MQLFILIIMLLENMPYNAKSTIQEKKNSKDYFYFFREVAKART